MRFGKKNFFLTDFDQTVVLVEKKNFVLQTVKIVKLGGVKEGGGGEKNFFFQQISIRKCSRTKKNSDLQTLKMVKLGGVGQ